MSHRDLDWTSLRLFALVCETGNIVRAGERASLAPSAISKRLALLDEQMGVALFTRRRHGMQATAAGEALLQHTRELMQAATRLERDMASHASGVRGVLRIWASASALSESLADDVAEFLSVAAHRNVQVDIEERVSPDIVRGVREGAAALGVCWDATPAAPLATRPYRRDELCLAVPAGHALARRRSVRFADILPHEQVSLPAGSAVQVLMQREAALLGHSLRPRVVVSSFESALRVVRAGLAVSVVPREIAAAHAKTLRVALVTLAEPWAKRRFVICHRDDAALSPAARLLVDHLSAKASDHDPA